MTRTIAILFLLFFATVQFFLLLRHKSPYMPDSYFYKHVYHEIQGDSFDDARAKVMDRIDLSRAGRLSRERLEDEEMYRRMVPFFEKRPFYPFVTATLHRFGVSEYWSFLLPVFLSYLGIIILFYLLARKGLSFLFAIFATALLVAYYPMLDWSTYFLTDTIGTFFWFGQLFFVWKYIREQRFAWLVFSGLVLLISFLNREQNVLFVGSTFLLFLFAWIVRPRLISHHAAWKLFFVTVIVSVGYFLAGQIVWQRSYIDTLTITQQYYGPTYAEDYTFLERAQYHRSAILFAHRIFLRDLVRHHWWVVFVVLSVIGSWFVFRQGKNMRCIDLLIFASTIASYAGIFVYPVLSDRYFFPVVLGVIYLSAFSLQRFFLPQRVFPPDSVQ